MKHLFWLIPVSIVMMLIILMLRAPDSTHKLDWTPVFGIYDKRPLGLFIFNRELSNSGQTTDIVRVQDFPSHYLNELNADDPRLPNSMMFIRPSANYSAEQWDKILNAVQHGLQLFLSVQNLPSTLEYRLNISIDRNFDTLRNITQTIGDHQYKIYAQKQFGHFTTRLRELPDLDTLGTFSVGTGSSVNLIRLAYGSGEIIIHCHPEAFSNYYLLRGNSQPYINELLSLLKPGRVAWLLPAGKDNRPKSQLSFIFSEYALRWAFLLSLMGIALFIFFNARRRQWVVPVIPAEQNTTLDFARTVSNLFLKNSSPEEILKMRRNFILDKIKSEFYLSQADPDITAKLASRTGNTQADADYLFRQLQQIEKEYFPDARNQLLKLDILINKFFYNDDERK